MIDYVCMNECYRKTEIMRMPMLKAMMMREGFGVRMWRWHADDGGEQMIWEASSSWQ
jgi:hypothetical protein